MIQLIEHAVEDVHVKFITDQILDGGSGLILVDPVIHLGDPGFDLLQKLYGKFFDFCDVALGQVFGEQQIVD